MRTPHVLLALDPNRPRAGMIALAVLCVLSLVCVAFQLAAVWRGIEVEHRRDRPRP